MWNLYRLDLQTTTNIYGAGFNFFKHKIFSHPIFISAYAQYWVM